MSDESRKAFETWAKEQDLMEGIETIASRIAWEARDAEVSALKAKIQQYHRDCALNPECGAGEQHE